MRRGGGGGGGGGGMRTEERRQNIHADGIGLEGDSEVDL